MRKIYYAILFLCVNISIIFAQTDADYERYLHLRQQEIESRDNLGFWTVSLSGGGTLYQGESDGESAINDMITPFGRLAVTRWIDAVWGIRMQIDGGLQKNSAIQIREPDSNGEFYFADGGLEVITNLMNWGAYKRSNRPVSVYLYGGVGMAWTPSRDTRSSQISPLVMAGGQFNVRMTDSWSVYVELDATIVKDNFNSYTGGRKYEGYVGGVIGLTYRFSSYKIR